MTTAADTLHAPVLTPEDHAQFHELGYIVLRQAIPPAYVRATMEAVHAFLGGGRPEQWYAEPYTKMGFVPMYHHQALWNNRQHPRVYRAFVELLGREDLWVTQDQVAIKLPAHPDHPGWGDNDFMHWDCDPRKPPTKLSLQGVLSLSDTPANAGGFQCIPGAHRKLGELTSKFAHIEDWAPMRPDETGVLRGNGTAIATQAGDMVIWDVRLTHGNCPNRSPNPRYSQYISYFPQRDEEERQKRIDTYNQRHGSGSFRVDERQWELKHTPQATLSPLGRKLLGIDRW